jgi:4-amino-4-deoxy-L-arabinose transferase-like glycosyltransferase
MAEIVADREVEGIAGHSIARLLALLLIVTAIGRVLFASSLGLGVDEAYTVATARHWALSTYDHPPLAWWLAGSAARLFGSESALVVRLPFIALFALSTWFAFATGRYLFNARAGLFAALALNLAPVIGWTSASFVLPDGPLIAAMLMAAYALSHVLFGERSRAPQWWLMTGVCAGLACLAKLHGIFLLLGTGLFILTSPAHRHWLLSPWPYAAALVAALVFSPVIIWNVQHDWVSFSFQAARARSTRLDLIGPIVALLGQALFLLPWLWAPLIFSLGRAARSGPADDRSWLLLCLAVGPIVVFTLIALNGTRVLYHWAAPGYVFAALLLGRDIASIFAGKRGTPTVTANWLKATIASVAFILLTVIAIARLPWPVEPIRGFRAPTYPLIETLAWTDAKTALRDRGLIGTKATFVAAVRWHEAGRLDWVLGGTTPVICLCSDPRGYGVIHRNRDHLGQDGLIIGPHLELREVRALLEPYFDSIETLEPIIVQQARQPIVTLQVFRGTRLHETKTKPDLIEPFGKPRS